jgi:hypothetical protein
MNMWVFGTDAFANLLFNAGTWYMDGQFDLTPTCFGNSGQLFTINIMHKDKLIPCIYAMLTHKSEYLYSKLFQELKTWAVECNKPILLTNTMSDYESGLLPAILACFPDVIRNGCLFHFSSALFRHVCSIGLRVRIITSTFVISLHYVS